MIFSCDFLTHLCELLFVPHHDSEMPHSIRLELFHFEDGEELMCAELEEGVTFSLVEFLKVEYILVKGDRLLHVIHFDGDMIAAVNLDAHEIAPTSQARLRMPLRNVGTPR